MNAGFVQFQSEAHAKKACAYSGRKLLGRPIKVMFAIPPKEGEAASGARPAAAAGGGGGGAGHGISPLIALQKAKRASQVVKQVEGSASVKFNDDDDDE